MNRNNINNILDNITIGNVNYNQILVNVVNDSYNNLHDTNELDTLFNVLNMQVNNVRNMNDFINFYSGLHTRIPNNNNEVALLHSIIRNIDNLFLNRARVIYQMIDNINRNIPNNNVNNNNNMNNNRINQ